MNHPLFIVTIWLIFGLILGKYISPPDYLEFLPYGIICIILLASSIQLYRFHYQKGKIPNGNTLFLAMICIGFTMQNNLEKSGNQANVIVKNLAEKGEIRVTGKLATNPSKRKFSGYF